MQRIRIGLTGLAFVFVLVLIAAVFSSASNEEPITPNMLEQRMGANGTVARAPEEEPSEPLAELGVAPGNPGVNGSADGGSGSAAR